MRCSTARSARSSPRAWKRWASSSSPGRPTVIIEIASRRALRTPADFAGLRVRTPGLSLLDQTLAKLGATTAAMRGADARLAALAGSLDAEETTTSAFRASHAAAAGLTHLQLWGAHADALMFAVNAQVWNAWSAADRELVRQAARDAAADAIALRLRQGGDAALGEAARQGRDGDAADRRGQAGVPQRDAPGIRPVGRADRRRSGAPRRKRRSQRAR